MENEQPPTSGEQTRLRPVAIYIVVAAILYALIQSYSVLSPILLSFIIVILITLAVNPVIARVQTWTGGRKRATVLALAGVLTICALSVWGSVVLLNQSVTTLSEKLPEYWERLQKPLIKLEQKNVLTEDKLQEEVSAEIAKESSAKEREPQSAEPRRPEQPQVGDVPAKTEKGEGSLRTKLVELLQGMFGQIKGVAHSASEMLIVLVTVGFGLIFSLLNPSPIFGALFSVVPERHHDKTLVIMVRIAKFVPLWAGSVLISMLTIGSLFFLMMWPIFGFADAIMLGLVASFFSVIPFIGPVLTLIPALLLAFGEGGMTPLWVVLAYSVVQALESNVVLPLVMSRGMNLHPVAVIFSMLLSMAIFGFLGVIIAAPLFAIVAIIHEEIYRKKYLPTTTDEKLDQLARSSLLEKT